MTYMEAFFLTSLRFMAAVQIVLVRSHFYSSLTVCLKKLKVKSWYYLSPTASTTKDFISSKRC